MPEEKEVVSKKASGFVQTIMIVEDDAYIGAFLVEAITQETPYHVMLVANGIEALNAVRNIKPSLLILDYHLPGINGLELYDQIHALPELMQIPAIMMSARLPRQELEKRTIVGIHKPFDLDDFLLAVKDLLE
jgi:DNA-binding response OmpR family regulator